VLDGLLLLVGGVAAGLFGSLLGLGGGILIVPLLTLGFGLPLLTAVGVSLVCVIVTSGAAAGVYLERRVANLRLGMTLELFTASGALVGGLIAFLLPERVLELIFAGLIIYVAVTMARRRDPARPAGAASAVAAAPFAVAAPAASPAPAASQAPAASRPDPWNAAGPEPEPGAAVEVGAEVTASVPDRPAVEERPAVQDPPIGARVPFLDTLSGPGYHVRRVPLGIVGSVVAGLASALLGIGGGLVKVPVMHVIMGVPLRVATATSNLMIGITASASAIIYLLRGGIDPYAAAPTAIGVFVGASVGSRVAHRIDLRLLRGLFVVVLLYTAWQMLQRAIR
jgi:hypothetical protein